jgi:hypothetical protein
MQLGIFTAGLLRINPMCMPRVSAKPDAILCQLWMLQAFFPVRRFPS